jgi:glycosyltransferase involved in cell wall biosynthesis
MTNDVSIIIPAFNAEKHIHETLESCIQQGRKVIKEVIIVDDHSTDNTKSIAQQWVDNHSFIKLYTNPKKGANSARNYGFQKSTANYIQFLDADDILGKDKIKNQLQLLSLGSEKVIACCGWGHFSKNIQEAEFVPSIIWKNYNRPLNWLIDAWTNGAMAMTGCWLTHRSLIEQAGPWDEDLIINQDGEFFCRVILKSSKIVFVKDSRVFYRKPQKGNVSQNKSFPSYLSLLKSYKSYEKNILAKLDNNATRMACATNYLNFIYQTHPKYPELLNQAKKHLDQLNLQKWPLVGGKKFKMMSKFVGFNFALKIRALTS